MLTRSHYWRGGRWLGLVLAFFEFQIRYRRDRIAYPEHDGAFLPPVIDHLQAFRSAVSSTNGGVV